MKPPPVSLGSRLLIAVGIPVAVVLATVAVLKFTTVQIPTDMLSALLAAAAFGGAALAVAVPWRRAPVLALAVAVAVGVLTYSPAARGHVGDGVGKAGHAGQNLVGKVKNR